jgi:predicted transcriptional regulator
MRISNYKFHQQGLNRFFGPLEAKIMEILWSMDHSLSIRDVHMRLEQEKDISFNTVMTVMNRLVDKGVLLKCMEGRSSMYRPSVTKAVFMETRSKELTHELLDTFGLLAVNHMIDALDDVDEDMLEKLQKKIDSMKSGG